MFDIIPFVLIAGALVAVLFVIIRKFPQLTLLDVDTIPEVVAEKKKDVILKKRIENRSKEQRSSLIRKSKPLIQKLKEIQLGFRKYVGKIERLVVKEKKEKAQKTQTPEVVAKKQSKLSDVLRSAMQAFESGDYDDAEQKCISIIKQDPKQPEAYDMLADVYLKQGQFDEAEETLQFLLQIDPNRDSAMMKLAELHEKKGDPAAAISWYEKAVLINPNISSRFAKMAELLNHIGEHETALEAIAQASELEPENPKYLDILTETSILCGKQEAAQEAFERLRMANPENAKLDSFKDRIEKMV